MRDDEDFNDISVNPIGNGIQVKLGGARAVLLNVEDAQFLCDALYVMLDEIRLDAEEEDE